MAGAVFFYPGSQARPDHRPVTRRPAKPDDTPTSGGTRRDRSPDRRAFRRDRRPVAAPARGAQPEDMTDDQTAEDARERARRRVADWPPPTPEELAKLRRILRAPVDRAAAAGGRVKRKRAG